MHHQSMAGRIFYVGSVANRDVLHASLLLGWQACQLPIVLSTVLLCCPQLDAHSQTNDFQEVDLEGMSAAERVEFMLGQPPKV